MALNWESVPFAIGANNLLREALSTKLPFTLGCGTQQGLEHREESFTNQDSLSLIIEENYVVGVICDGCTSASPEFFNAISSNQVGANFIANCLSKILNEFLRENSVADILSNISPIEAKLIAKIRAFANLLENESSLLFRAEVMNSLMATIVAFAIDKNNYAIMNCGDGVIILNGKVVDLENYQGQYLSVQLLEQSNSERNKLGVLLSGDADEINSLFIASDGFSDSVILNNDSLKAFITERPKFPSGFQKDFISNFRIDFINPYLETVGDYNSFPSDDASFILLRRTMNVEVEAPVPPKVNEPVKKESEYSTEINELAKQESEASLIISEQVKTDAQDTVKINEPVITESNVLSKINEPAQSGAETPSKIKKPVKRKVEVQIKDESKLEKANADNVVEGRSSTNQKRKKKFNDRKERRRPGKNRDNRKKKSNKKTKR